MVGKTKVLDGSRWQWGSKSDYSFDPQKPPNLQKVKDADVDAIWWRATYGNFYVDPSFELTYQLALALGIPFGAYHVVSPDCSIDSQFNLFKSVCIGKKLIRPALDNEVNANKSPATVTACIQGCVLRIQDWLSIDPLMYSRASWWNVNVLPWSGWEKLPLWPARYNDGLTSPWSDDKRYRFRDWGDWKMWQFSADGNERGAEFGMRSSSVDIDRFNGTLAEFREFAGIDQPAPLPEPAESRLIVTNCNYLNFRPSPGGDPTLGSLRAGQEVTDLKNNSGAWRNVEIRLQAWMHGSYLKPKGE